ncbi:redox-sensitive transcriptional activator SoxR [Pseudoalteromonas sp. NBT06-2]|uniref:redox-sensitive transcriptional activator SoxR n=1 Tax=Pseudoalteromonas sp. NBT06-2 TaxID=2025950 RepID=UPI000BA5C2A0|nr:redox-sensitive transcriptional activator SoxR [Pseudoalteromonas sp. NBT06-2]PAJ75497.1 redox-sensitive transcriptional activator SoxR [Pseudoalteromonas sp. NBT06-2]
MNLEEANLTVGYIAKRCGIKVSTLHFYEEKGLIRSWRNQGNQRRYKRDVLRRIAVIKAAQKIGIKLDDIKQTFSDLPNERTPCKGDWAKLSANWQKQLDARIAYMQKLRDSVKGCIGCGCLSMENCPIYNPNDELAEEGTGAVLLHRS